MCLLYQLRRREMDSALRHHDSQSIMLPALYKIPFLPLQFDLRATHVHSHFCQQLWLLCHLGVGFVCLHKRHKPRRIRIRGLRANRRNEEGNAVQLIAAAAADKLNRKECHE